LDNVEQLEQLNKLLALVPEDHASQVSDSKFEPEKNESLIYFKLCAMNANSIKNNEHKVDRIFGPEKGYMVYGNCDHIRTYLHIIVDMLMDQAVEGSKSNL